MNNTIDQTKLFGTDSRSDDTDASALVKRINYILRFYGEWMSNKGQEKEDMYSVLNNGFGTGTGYNLKSFLSDYHFVVDDKNRRLITTTIHKMEDETQDKEEDTVCDSELCRVIDRSELDRTKARQMYFYTETDNATDINRNICIQQILDSLHIFMYHTFRIHPRNTNRLKKTQQIKKEMMMMTKKMC
eukprot:1128466_1